MIAAVAQFAAFEAAVFAASARLAGRLGADRWLAILAIDVLIEASLAQAFSFAHLNSRWAYWAAAIALAAYGRLPSLKWPRAATTAALIAALSVPLLAVGFRPVEEIDSINYLHYLIEWMANRATPYSFATYYVALWELSFLPAWTVTGLDVFFPILALKGVALVALAAWAVGRELDVAPGTLAWTVFGAVSMRHYWLEYSGVATLKNDALHGAGFLLLLVVIIRVSKRRLDWPDVALFTIGLIFSCVKYSGMFTGALAAAAIVWQSRDRRLLWALPVWVLTSGHYYLRSTVQFGNPFYPFQINLGPLRLPGEADLSYTSILYNLGDPQLWRLLLAPEGGISPAGVLFPAILAGALLVCVWRWRDWGAVFVLCGWLLYFRSVYSASAGHGDLAFLRNSLNSIRYVDGVLAASEVYLASALGRLALPFMAINTASRLALVWGRLTFPVAAVAAIALAVGAAVWLARRRAVSVVAAALLIGGPIAVEQNRARWTTYWDDLKPALANVRGPDLAAFAMNEGSYYAGHVVAAGNPVDSRVRALLPEEIERVRPKYLAVLVTPGFDWRGKHGQAIAGLGYVPIVVARDGALFQLPARQ